MVAVAVPHGSFEPAVHTLGAGTDLYRVFSGRSGRTATEFNPEFGAPSRFAFFEDTHGILVPVLYAAATQAAAICESLLHDVPAAGGALEPVQYQDKVMALIRPTRDLRLASLMGLGLRQIRAPHDEICSTDPSRYPATALWAKAAHESVLDGIIWMSHRCNTDHAMVFFGDRVTDVDLEQSPSFARAFELDPDRSWLIDFCAPLHFDVRS